MQSNGLKATLPRIRVLRLFQDAPRRHLCAEEVYLALAAQGADVGLATVDRMLMPFVRAELLARRQFEGDKAVFELVGTEHHEHLVCVHCGRVEEFVDTEIKRRQQAIARERGFEREDHELALYGRCAEPACPSGR